VKRNQRGRIDAALLLELPDQAAVGVVLEVEQARRQGGGGQGAQSAAVVEIKPATPLQLLEHHAAVVGGEAQHQIAEGFGLGLQLHQRPQTVMAIHHPEGAIATAHQGHRFAAEVALALGVTFVGEVPLAAAYLRQAHAELGGLQIGHRHAQKFLTGRGGRQGLVRGELQTHGSHPCAFLPVLA